MFADCLAVGESQGDNAGMAISFAILAVCLCPSGKRLV